ncbi:MAG: phosphatidate cytidylyltransferase [Myxococcota bacterium]|nr:phosphatidate cytidylyltransferase [Myxococcota bacterium]
MAQRSGLGWRFLTAGVLVPILLAVTFWLPPAFLLAFAVAAAAVAAWEGMALAVPYPTVLDRAERSFGAGSAAAVAGLSAWAAAVRPEAAAAVFPAVFLAAMTLLVVRPRDLGTFAPRASGLIFVPLYVGLGLAVYPAFRLLFPDGVGGELVILTMTLAFLGDTAAYFAGRFLGRRPLHPRLSPKKTIEGAVGGIVGSALAVALAAVWYLPALGWIDVLLLATIGGAAGQAGDLFESGLKRSVGLKDSGTLLPGHGGLLDRIDALIPTGFVTLAHFLLRPLWADGIGCGVFW